MSRRVADVVATLLNDEKSTEFRLWPATIGIKSEAGTPCVFSDEAVMSEDNKQDGIKEYADGWITERKGTDVPMFLKVAYVFIAGGCLTYLIIFMNGEVNHSDRGVLVRAFNAATQSSSGLMYAVAGIGLVYALILIVFAFSKAHED